MGAGEICKAGAPKPMQPSSMHTFGRHDSASLVEDSVRADAYESAMTSRQADFNEALCLDIGAGPGILSFLAAKAGARAVLAVEPSEAALLLRNLITAPSNARLANRIHVVHGFLEDVPRNIKADIIVSDPFASLLFSEYTAVSAFLTARDRFLKPGGLLFPENGAILLAPFSDAAMREGAGGRAAFWHQESFHGVDLRPAFSGARRVELARPVVAAVNASTLVAPAERKLFDFHKLSMQDLENLSVPFSFDIAVPSGRQPGAELQVDGIAIWFDLFFPGGSVLSTSPQAPSTHWKQTLMFLPEPLKVNAGQRVIGEFHIEVKEAMLVHFRMCSNEATCSESGIVDIRRQHFRLQPTA